VNGSVRVTLGADRRPSEIPVKDTLVQGGTCGGPLSGKLRYSSSRKASTASEDASWDKHRRDHCVLCIQQNKGFETGASTALGDRPTCYHLLLCICSTIVRLNNRHSSSHFHVRIQLCNCNTCTLQPPFLHIFSLLLDGECHGTFVSRWADIMFAAHKQPIFSKAVFMLHAKLHGR
jgi:hypothetical protein